MQRAALALRAIPVPPTQPCAWDRPPLGSLRLRCLSGYVIIERYC